MSHATGLFQVGKEGSRIRMGDGAYEKQMDFIIPEGIYTLRDIVDLLNGEVGWRKFHTLPGGRIGFRRDPVPVVEIEEVTE